VNRRLAAISAAGLIAAMTGQAFAGELVYRPINPNFGGDPLNGNYILGTAQAQQEGGGGGSGFSIDFPDFGGIPQPTPPTPPTELPDVDAAGAGAG
jgi:hypothetical protein